MPAGHTHDRITLWTLPLVAGLTFGQTHNGNLTLLVSGGFLFGGLMFGPDLDIYSRQYQRWGWLRWLWLPYQKSLRHRSYLSHGPLIGTGLRVIYLVMWIGIFVSLGLVLSKLFGDIHWTWLNIGQIIGRSLVQHYPEYLALYIGLEIGAMSHSVSDWSSSAYKRWKKKGIKAFFLPTKKTVKHKRKSSQRNSRQR